MRRWRQGGHSGPFAVLLLDTQPKEKIRLENDDAGLKKCISYFISQKFCE